jgi:16S rRNA (cytidine1402-2'-O)-methyltransferase
VSAPQPGTLYVVATPIGNLEDITLRAIRVLREADAIACEDTRHTRKLLDHLGISKPTVSYHEHNEAERADDLIARLRGGQSIALVSDAGTPLISDPGFRVVHRALDEGFHVVAVPGPCAAVVALAGSGLPTHAFTFAGFLPRKEGERRRLLESLRDREETLIFYEAPHRILETLDDVAEVLGNPPVVVARELTKLHEESVRGSAAEVRAVLGGRPGVKGEITLLIGPERPGAAAVLEPVAEAVRRLEGEGVSRMDAMKRVARERGLPKREVYRQVEAAG